jgi:hypothetical protein
MARYQKRSFRHGARHLKCPSTRKAQNLEANGRRPRVRVVPGAIPKVLRRDETSGASCGRQAPSPNAVRISASRPAMGVTSP